MILTGYTKRLTRPECNHEFESLHCIAELDDDISEVLPYLNAELGGTHYVVDPPQVMFHHQGRIIKVSGKEIAINALTDEAQADQILTWLVNEINEAWANRESIEPRYKGKDRPILMEILKRLPKTNCKACGQPTCMVFAAQVVEGGRTPSQCPELSPEKRDELENYLADFDIR